MTPLLVVLSSPSGGGKSTIAKELLAASDEFGYSISATTRNPRGVEQHGVHYHFLSPTAFEGKVQDGHFVEHATYNGQRYGTLKTEVDRVLESGRHVILAIEVVGAASVRRQFPEAVLIFLLPPSAEVLVERLKGRGTDSDAEISGRLEQAVEELTAAAQYDYLVVNQDLAVAVGQVRAIIEAESLKVARRRGILPHLEQLRRDVAAQLTSLVKRRTEQE